MATAISGAINKQQSLGLDLGSRPGAGAALFSVGAPRVLRVQQQRRQPRRLSLTVTDSSQLQASDYALQFDGTNYTITRQLDQQRRDAAARSSPRSLATGVSVDGMSLTIEQRHAAPGDRFLLQPVGGARRRTCARVLDDPSGLAAGVAVRRQRGRRATPAPRRSPRCAAVNPAYDPHADRDDHFTANSGDYSWELSDARPTPGTGTGTWTAGSPIALNGFELQARRRAEERRHGQRRADRVARRPTTATRSRCRPGRRRLAIVSPSGGAASQGMTITDAYASAMADIGVRVQGGKAAPTISTARGRARPRRRARTGRRQPRRGGGAADPVPAELPGGSEDPAGRASPCSTRMLQTAARLSHRYEPTEGTMRIATANAYDVALEQLHAPPAELADAQEQLTSGKRVNRASDDPAAAARAERALAAEARSDANQRAVDASDNAMTLTESALGDAGELLQQVARDAGGGRQRRATATPSAQAHRGPDRATSASSCSRSRTAPTARATYLFGGQGSTQPPFIDAAGGVQFPAPAGSARPPPASSLPLTRRRRADLDARDAPATACSTTRAVTEHRQLPGSTPAASTNPQR